ncbi:MAG: MFS transporter [Candidatus Aenigmarchaeota archaeon]|nr:MFS transporter [Candidatus Aenigmarchaeota archaeon]
MKPNLIRLLTFAAAQISFVYIIIFARGLGISDVEIGIIVAFYSLTLFFSSYIFGRASDRYGRKIFMLIGLLAATIAFFLQTFAHDYTSLLLIRILVGFCVGIYPSALVAYVHEMKKNMGKFASFGSLGWFFGLMVAGITATYFTIKGIFILSSLFSLLAFLVTFTLEPVKYKPIKVPFFPLKILKKNKSVYLSVLIRHSGAYIIWTFWPLYLMSLGADLFWVAIIEAVNSFTQFLFMFAITDRFKSILLLKIGLLFSALTFFSFTLALNFWQILPIQVLLGISWSFVYVGALRHLTERNVEKATVSGILDSVLSLSSIVGPILATIILSFGNYRMTMYVASLLAFISFFVFNIFKSKNFL